MTLNPQKRGFRKFFAILACNTHFKSNLHQNGWRQTWTTSEKELLRLSRVSWALLRLLVILQMLQY